MTTLADRQVILGRRQELALLAGLISDARSTSRVLGIVGEPGQGKTTLINAAIDGAAAIDSQVLAASGIEAEAGLPFAGLHQLLSPVLQYATRLPSRQQVALRSALGMGEDEAPERFLVGLAVLSLLSEIAEQRPLVVAIDDAQWMDRGSIDAVAFASRRLHAEPIAVLVTARRDMDLAPFGSDAARLLLEPLPPSDAIALLDTSLPGLAPRLRARILEEAAGNPLVLVEFARSQPGPGEALVDGVALAPTARLERLFERRLDAMPLETRRALLIAAAADAADTATALRAAAILRLPPDCFAPAEHDGLIAMGADSFRFRHPVLRSAIYYRASQADRQAIHLALASALEATPDRAAWHRASVAGEPDEAVAAALEAAAERARLRAGFGAASRAMRRAAVLTPDAAIRARRMVAAVAHAFSAGETSTVLELDRELRTLTDDPVPLGQAAVWVAQVQVLQGVGRTSESLSIPAMQGLLATDPIAAISLMAVAAGYAYLDGDREAAGALDHLIKAIPGAGDEPWRLYILAAVDPVGNASAVRPQLAAMVHDVHASEQILRVTSHIPWYLDDHVAADVLLGRWVDAAREQGAMGALASYVVPLALNDVRLGRLSDAVMHATEGVRVALEVGQPAMAAVGVAVQALVAAMRGEREVAQARADEVAQMPNGGFARALATWALGLDALAAGKPDAALGHLRRLSEPDDPVSHPEIARFAIADLVDAGVGAGMLEDLESRTALAERQASTASGTRALMVARRARAVLDDGPGSLFESALAVDRGATWPFEQARTRLSYGVWLRRHRRIMAAREPLRMAMEAFAGLGAEAWEARAKAELRASGEASEIRARGLSDELTPQQRQVAQLAAKGLSNREIGAQLYLSPRTVSFHLYQIYPKLGITTRSQLSGALHGEPHASGYVP